MKGRPPSKMTPRRRDVAAMNSAVESSARCSFCKGLRPFRFLPSVVKTTVALLVPVEGARVDTDRLACYPATRRSGE